MIKNKYIEIKLPFAGEQLSFQLPRKNLLALVSPNPLRGSADAAVEVRRALENPIGAPPLREAARGAKKILIVADDLTRQTPVDVLIPMLLDELNAAGVRDEQVSVLIGLGTHRAMTPAEIEARFGAGVLGRVRVENHAWWLPEALADLGQTPNGTPIQVNRLALESDFVIGLGSIVPHHIPGYSAGAKIIQPGITGAATTGATHFLSTRTRRSYLGMVENIVRTEMETIAERAGLKAILNVVLDIEGCVYRAVYGEPRQAFRAGAQAARAVYGVELPGQAEIVVANSCPCEIEFWQAHKSLYPADMAVRPGGRIIVTTPCPEGVSVTHGAMLEITALPAERIEAMLLRGEVADTASGALALAWAKIRARVRVSLVSPGIGPEDTRRLGFDYFPSVQDALAAAFAEQGAEARVSMLDHAPDTLPLLPGEMA
jgi:lactate racemase